MKHSGRFGDYGGFYVPEVLIPALEQLEEAFYRYREDENFCAELDNFLKDYAGRPTPLYYAKRFSEHVGFNVYRAVRAGAGEFEKGELLNGTPLPPQGSASAGAQYESIDLLPLESGEERWYLIEDIDLSGARTLHGPFKALVAQDGEAPNMSEVRYWYLY